MTFLNRQDDSVCLELLNQTNLGFWAAKKGIEILILHIFWTHKFSTLFWRFFIVFSWNRHHCLNTSLFFWKILIFVTFNIDKSTASWFFQFQSFSFPKEFWKGKVACCHANIVPSFEIYQGTSKKRPFAFDFTVLQYGFLIELWILESTVVLWHTYR